MSLAWVARRRLVSGIVIGVWSAAVIAGQAAQAGMPAALRARVRDERFQPVTSIRGLPLGVRDQLQSLFGGPALDIADPDAGVQAGRAGTGASPPLRRLVAAGCSYAYCLVYYERGGATRSWHVALFHWTPGATLFEWGGHTAGGLTTFDDVRARMLSGALLAGAREPW